MNSREPNHYEILNLAQTATDVEIRKAYNAALLAHHPDNGGSTDQLMKVQEAFKTLSDTDNRESYDKELRLIKSFKEFSDSLKDLMKLVYQIKQNRLYRFGCISVGTICMALTSDLTSFYYPNFSSVLACITIPLDLYIIKEAIAIAAENRKEIESRNQFFKTLEPIVERIIAHDKAWRNLIEEHTPRLEWKPTPK